jgi:hypothetical protein
MGEDDVAPGSAGEPAPKKQRLYKPLPPGLADIGPQDLTKFYCAVEVHAGRNGSPTTEANVAQSIETTAGVVNLDNDLVLDQLRKLCRNLGIKINAGTNKFQCRKSIAILKDYEGTLKEVGTHPRSTEARATNTLLRAVNVVFGSALIDRFKTLNDSKDRVDHETRNLYEHFWRDAELEFNDFENGLEDIIDDDDDEVRVDEKLVIVNSSNDEHLQEFLDIDEDFVNLRDVDNMTADVLKKKIMLMFKVRRQMKENMTVSGTHDNSAYNFLDIAMNKVKGAKILSKIGMYYFYCRCEEHDDIDASFQPFLDGSIRGSTACESSLSDELEEDESLKTNKSSFDPKTDEKKLRKKAYESIGVMTTHAANMYKEMQAANEELKRNNRAKNNMKKLQATIEVAKAMGDHSLLQSLLVKLQEEDFN